VVPGVLDGIAGGDFGFPRQVAFVIVLVAVRAV
jgi:hypothetical protein